MSTPTAATPPRRAFLAAAASTLAPPVLAQGQTAPSGTDTPASRLERSRTRVQGFADAEMDYQLLRQLGWDL